MHDCPALHCSLVVRTFRAICSGFGVGCSHMLPCRLRRVQHEPSFSLDDGVQHIQRVAHIGSLPGKGKAFVIFDILFFLPCDLSKA